MMNRRIGWAAAMLLLAGCEAKIGSGTAKPGSVAGQAEAGTISIDAPGLDMKLKIPEAIRAEIGGDTDIVYPGATLGGLHVAASADSERGGNGSVEMRFTTPDAVEKVAAWYRDPVRAAELAVASAVREGTGMVISGTSARAGDPFTLRLQPASGGGTEARLVLRDRAG
jgi:hypothetical protein